MKISFIQCILIHYELYGKSQNYHKKTTESIKKFFTLRNSKHNRKMINYLESPENNSVFDLYSFYQISVSYLFLNIKETIQFGKLKHIFNDPYIDEQWYFTKKNHSQHQLSHQLENIWEKNITGNGVIIGLIGDGFDPTHRDLRRNYVSHLSYNFVKNSFHITTSGNGNLTMCAGLMSAIADNNQCGVGGAPSSQFAILQVFDDDHIKIDHNLNQKAVNYYFHDIQIYTILFMGCGYQDLNIGISNDFISAVELGKRMGRKRLGSIYIAGNGIKKHLGRNCAFYAYQQLPEIFVVGSITKDGYAPFYSEQCNAILAATLNSLSARKQDLIYSTSPNNYCEKSASGTCSSVSIAAAIIALVLEDNPHLTSRQIMVLIILTSTQYDNNSILNKAGFRYSYSMGFGMLNSDEMIRSSRNHSISNLAEEHVCQSPTFRMRRIIQKNSNISFNIYSNGCLDTQSCVTHVEQLFLTFSIKTLKRRSVRMYLTSPSGTMLYVLEPRIFDVTSIGFHSWTIKIMGFYGEIAAGIWNVEIFSDSYFSIVRKLKLKIHGTCVNPKINFIIHSKYIARTYPQQQSSTSNIKRMLPYLSKRHQDRSTYSDFLLKDDGNMSNDEFDTDT